MSKVTDSIKGDLVGGLILSILSIPSGIALGAAIFAPLGADYLTLGIAAGLIAITVTNLIGAFIGGNTIMTYGPNPLVAFMLATAMSRITQQDVVKESVDPAATAVVCLLILMLCAGLFQVLMGLFKVGLLAKYIPFPAIAGMMNGTAILLFASQVRPMLGITPEGPLTDWSFLVHTFQPWTLLIGVVTTVVILYGSRLTSKIPSEVLGILCGTALYYVLSQINPPLQLGPRLGEIPIGLPLPRYGFELLGAFTTASIYGLLIEFLPLALTVALVTTLRTLLGVVAVDHLTQERSNSDQELIGQGLGNMVSVLFGGIVVSGYSGIAILAYQSGARTKRVRLVVSLMTLLVLVVVGPFVDVIPKVVLAGTLVAAAIVMLDPWSLGLVKQLWSKSGRSRNMISDLILVLLATGAIAGFGIFKGVAAGILMSVILFVYRMSRYTIRRHYDATRVRSNVERLLDEILLLEAHGNRIHVFELEGSLFFGTTDKIAEAVESVLEQEGDYIVLDFRHVSDIDSTGLKLLSQLEGRVAKANKTLILSSIDTQTTIGPQARELGISDYISYEQCFPSIDEALGWAEDRLLDSLKGADRYAHELKLNEIDVLTRMRPSDYRTFVEHCQKNSYLDGDVLFDQSEEGDSVYFIVRGRIRLYATAGPASTLKRPLATLCPGTVCGEMALLDGKPRVATAMAEGDLTCYRLSLEQLQALRKRQPDVAYRLLEGLGQELAKRVRIANRQSTELRA